MPSHRRFAGSSLARAIVLAVGVGAGVEGLTAQVDAFPEMPIDEFVEALRGTPIDVRVRDWYPPA